MLSPAEEKMLSPSGVDADQTKKLNINDFNPKLIDNFKKEHRVLIAMFKRIHSNATNHNTEDVRADLKKFRLLLTGHLLKENQHLYSYLYKTLSDETSVDMVKDMKKEMDGIGSVVLSFIAKYSKHDSSIDEVFMKDLGEIGEALVSRIQNEEQHLYPNYLPEN